MKVVRAAVGEKRIVGVNILPRKLAAVRALIAKGVVEPGRDRIRSHPSCAFLSPRGELAKLTCSGQNSVESVNFDLGKAVRHDVVFIRCFKKSAGEERGGFQEVPWHRGPRLHLNGQPLSLPRAMGPLILDQALLNGNHNDLNVVWTAETRMSLTVQVGNRRSVAEVRGR